MMSVELQRRVHESHPELACCGMAGYPMPFNKKSAQGREERLRVLKRLPHRTLQRLAAALCRGKAPFRPAAPDDLIDACALAWVAWRIGSDTARRIPAAPPVDRKGLRMGIWY